MDARETLIQCEEWQVFGRNTAYGGKTALHERRLNPEAGLDGGGYVPA